MGGAWCGNSFGDSGMHALLHLCCCLTNTFVQTQNSQLKTETRTIESQTKIIVTQTRATQTKSVDWLSQNNNQLPSSADPRHNLSLSLSRSLSPTTLVST
jgi:hypothetical protein